jgi:hypothetical protein
MEGQTPKMAVIHEGSAVKLIHLQYTGSEKNMRYNQRSHLYTWKYIVARYKKEFNSNHYFRLVLQHMLRTVKMDKSYTYNVVFEISPTVIQHTDGYYYILLRIRVNPKAVFTLDEVIHNVMEKFNMVYRDDIEMERCSDNKSVEYLKNLFIIDRPSSTPSTPPEPKYALATLQKAPPVPPMPTTFDLKLLEAYYSLLLNPISCM